VLYNLTYAASGYGSPFVYAVATSVISYRFLTMNVLWFAGWTGAALLVWKGLQATESR
jgi:hypothetical protein